MVKHLDGWAFLTVLFCCKCLGVKVKRNRQLVQVTVQIGQVKEIAKPDVLRQRCPDFAEVSSVSEGFRGERTHSW